MNCPKCLGKLQKKSLHDIEVDVCYVCEGIWFDKGELAKILDKDSKDWRLDTLGVEDFDGKEVATSDIDFNEEPGRCPRCQEETRLERIRSDMTVKDVYVDACPNGHGIWLDGGETQLLRRRGLANLKMALENFKTQWQSNMELLLNRLLSKNQ